MNRSGADEAASLLDLVDRVLETGVVIHGEVLLCVAGIDLVHVGLSAVLKAAGIERVQAP